MFSQELIYFNTKITNLIYFDYTKTKKDIKNNPYAFLKIFNLKILSFLTSLCGKKILKNKLSRKKVTLLILNDLIHDCLVFCRIFCRHNRPDGE